MYYDDEARRFNFLSGFLLGAVLGTGIGLLAAPHRTRQSAGMKHLLRDGARKSERSVSDLLKSARRS